MLEKKIYYNFSKRFSVHNENVLDILKKRKPWNIEGMIYIFRFESKGLCIQHKPSGGQKVKDIQQIHEKSYDIFIECLFSKFREMLKYYRKFCYQKWQVINDYKTNREALNMCVGWKTKTS